ncbi:hypothetical protein, partial [Mesorhizobium sp. M0244]|uniref:hypothetical protein n=1 Tax=Mesorhizobium sp. M0244 TaxID=2956926 RepID=UPI0033367E27
RPEPQEIGQDLHYPDTNPSHLGQGGRLDPIAARRGEKNAWLNHRLLQHNRWKADHANAPT